MFLTEAVEVAVLCCVEDEPISSDDVITITFPLEEDETTASPEAADTVASPEEAMLPTVASDPVAADMFEKEEATTPSVASETVVSLFANELFLGVTSPLKSEVGAESSGVVSGMLSQVSVSFSVTIEEY